MNQFTYQSEDFTTKKECKEYVKECKEKLCKHFGYERNKIRIPNGLIELWFLPINSDKFIYYSNTISDFDEIIKNHEKHLFFIRCNVELKN